LSILAVVTEAVVVATYNPCKKKKEVFLADGMELKLSSPEDFSTTCSSRVGF
jgi:hypothetical protein